MQDSTHSPFAWLRELISALQWPVIVGASFWLGRYVQELEHRVSKAESRIEALVERHMPSIHRALAEIRGMLSNR